MEALGPERGKLFCQAYAVQPEVCACACVCAHVCECACLNAVCMQCALSRIGVLSRALPLM